MKRIFTLLVSIMLLTSGSTAIAQSAWAVKVNPLSLIYLTGNIQTELSFKENQSMNLGLHISGLSIGDVSYTGIGLTPEYRFYLTGEELDGFYVGPYLRYQRFSLSQDNVPYIDPNTFAPTTFNYEAILSRIGGGGIVGRQWMFKKGFTLDIYLGLGFVSNSVSIEATRAGYNAEIGRGFADGVTARSGITLGFGKRKK